MSQQVWTLKLGTKLAKLKRTRAQIAGLAALAEYARAVRVVKREMKRASDATATETDNARSEIEAYWQGQYDVCSRIIAAIQQGRTPTRTGGKG